MKKIRRTLAHGLSPLFFNAQPTKITRIMAFTRPHSVRKITGAPKEKKRERKKKETKKVF
jgi:hypothetical protein